MERLKFEFTLEEFRMIVQSVDECYESAEAYDVPPAFEDLYMKLNKLYNEAKRDSHS